MFARYPKRIQDHKRTEMSKKNHLSSIILLFVAGLLAVSCSTGTDTKPKAVIMGDYFPMEEYIFLNKVSASNVKMLDSADLSTGQPFMFEVNAPEYTVYRLAHKELYPLMVVARNGDTIRIRQRQSQAWPYAIEAPEECLILTDYLEKLNRDHHQVDSLSAVFHNSQSNPDFARIRDQLNEEFIRLHEGHKAFAREYVSRHPSSIASIIIVNGFFKEFALFNQRDDFGYYEMLDEALMARMPENKHVLDFHKQVENIRASNEYELEAKMRLSPGRLIPEFKLSGKDGKQYGPADYEGKPLLIYFWAAADAKSRQINPLIKKIHESTRPYGLELLCISFDKDPSVWEAAIRLDELPGRHVTDLKGAGSPVQKLFNLKMQLPAYFLVDNKGRIFDHDTDFSRLSGDITDMFTQRPEN